MARKNLSPADREFGRMLQKARLRAKLTQAAVARQFKIEPQAVSGWERGTSQPEINKLLDLASLYRASVEEIFNRDLAAAVKEALLVGKVGAGAEITRFDEGAVLAGIEPPAGLDAPNVAEISGDSQYPLQEGWLIFYGPEHQGVAEDCIGKLCVVQVKDGPTLLKTVKRGTRRDLFRLESWNAPPREDVRLVWAAKVKAIVPR